MPRAVARPPPSLLACCVKTSTVLTRVYDRVTNRRSPYVQPVPGEKDLVFRAFIEGKALAFSRGRGPNQHKPKAASFRVEDVRR